MASQSYNQAFGLLMPCMLRPPVYCMYKYNVQISHTSLVFVSECNTQSHMVGFLLLQVAPQQQLNRASWWSFECYYPTEIPVSVYHCRGSV